MLSASLDDLCPSYSPYVEDGKTVVLEIGSVVFHILANICQLQKKRPPLISFFPLLFLYFFFPHPFQYHYGVMEKFFFKIKSLIRHYLCLSSGCYNKTPQTRWRKHQTFLSRSPGGGEVQGQDVGRFLVRIRFLARRWFPWHGGGLWSLSFILRD